MEAVFLGSFAYVGVKTVGRWVKFRGDVVRHHGDADFFTDLDEALRVRAAAGARPAGGERAGEGASANGQGQLWVDWPRLRVDHRVALMESMLQVLRFTGEDRQWRHLSRARGHSSWAKLSAAERAELAWAADALDWSFVPAAIEAAGRAPEGPAIWEITEALPQLSEEPLRARAPRQRAEELRRLVSAREAAVVRALRAGQVAAAARLAPVKELGVADASSRVAELRALLQGTLGLSSGGRAVRGQDLMELLASLTLTPASPVVRQLVDGAIGELEEEVSRAVQVQAEAAEADQRAAEARARAAAVEAALRDALRRGTVRAGEAGALLVLGCEMIGEHFGIPTGGGSGAGFDGPGSGGGGRRSGAGGDAAAADGCTDADALRVATLITYLLSTLRGRGAGGTVASAAATSPGAQQQQQQPAGAADEAARLAARLLSEVEAEAVRRAKLRRRSSLSDGESSPTLIRAHVPEGHPLAAANPLGGAFGRLSADSASPGRLSGGGGGLLSPTSGKSRSAGGAPLYSSLSPGKPPAPPARGDLLAPCLTGLQALAADLAGAGPGEGGYGDGYAEMDMALSEMRFNIAMRVARETAALSADHAAALSAAREAERARLVSRRGAALAADDGAAAAVEGLDPSRPSAAVRRLAYTELYLRYLGSTQTLEAALPQATALAAVAFGPGRGMACGHALDAASAAAAARVGRLLEEIRLIGEIVKLELGPGVAATLGRVASHLDRVADPAPPGAAAWGMAPAGPPVSAWGGGRGRRNGGSGGSSGASSSRSLGARSSGSSGSGGGARSAAAGAAAPGLDELLDGLTLNADEERAAAARCRELVGALQSDGLVLLGLAPEQYAALRAVRSAVVVLRGGDAPGAAHDRAVEALREAAVGLREVVAAVQGMVLPISAGFDARATLTAQKERLAEVSDRVQAFLAYEDSTRVPALAAIRSLKVSADAASVVPNSVAGARAALDVAAAAEEQLAKLAALVGRLPAPPASPNKSPDKGHAAALAGASAALEELSAALSELRGALGCYLQHVALRQHALGALADAEEPSAAEPSAAAAAAAADEEGAGAAVQPSSVPLPTLKQLEPKLNAPLQLLSETSEEDQSHWAKAGNAAIARGQVAAVLIATGTVPRCSRDDGAPPRARAVVPTPGLPSGKCPLQLYAERILRAQALAAADTFGPRAQVTRRVPLFIVTSPETHNDIAAALERRRFFGLQQGQVQLVRCDAAAPCLDADLRVVLSGPSALAAAPPGSAAALPALRAAGALAAMARAGVRHVEVNTVDDNLLWRPADAVFIGYAVARGASAAAKVVEPQSVEGAYGGAAAAAAAAAAAGAGVSGSSGGSVAAAVAAQAPVVGAYYFTLPALERLSAAPAGDVASGLRPVPAVGVLKRGAPTPPPPALAPGLSPLERARPLVAAARAVEAATAPRAVDGYALQRGVCDALRSGAAGALPPGSVALLGVSRSEEFATVWGRGPHWAPGPPEGGAARVLGLHTAWAEAAGARVKVAGGVEVSPLASYAGEGLGRLCRGATFARAFHPRLQGAAGAGDARPARSNAGPWGGPLAVGYLAALTVAAAKSVAAGAAERRR